MSAAAGRAEPRGWMDRGLVERARQGDHDAFERLAGNVAPRLAGVSRLITGDPEMAKDAVQDALVRAWRDLPTLRDPDRFEAWLHRILVRACADVLRRNRRWSIEVELSDDHQPVVGDPAVHLANRDAIERGFRQLDAEQRAVVVFHYYLGLPLAEVAELLNVPVGTAKSRLARALRSLRTSLGADVATGSPVIAGRLA
jgi:RNA polymerase sigma-70 factor, ECF subfamily